MDKKTSLKKKSTKAIPETSNYKIGNYIFEVTSKFSGENDKTLSQALANILHDEQQFPHA